MEYIQKAWKNSPRLQTQKLKKEKGSEQKKASSQRKREAYGSLVSKKKQIGGG
jgi:hypothetical protein